MNNSQTLSDPNDFVVGEDYEDSAMNQSENAEGSIDDLLNTLGDNFLKKYESIEVASKLEDGNYTVLITKSDVLPYTFRESNTIILKLRGKVVVPENAKDKLFLYDFVLTGQNDEMLKKMFYALGLEYPFREQLQCFTRLVGSQIIFNLKTKDDKQYSQIREMVDPGPNLSEFRRNLGIVAANLL